MGIPWRFSLQIHIKERYVFNFETFEPVYNFHSNEIVAKM